MIITLAFKAERFSTDTFYCGNAVVLAFYAICAIGPRATFIRVACACEKLADLFLVLVVQFLVGDVVGGKKDIFDGIVEEGCLATHALHERIHIIQVFLNMASPARSTEPMLTNINDKSPTIGTDSAFPKVTHFLDLLRGEKFFGIANQILILFHVEKIIPKGIFLPFEFPQNEEGPSKLECNSLLGLFGQFFYQLEETGLRDDLEGWSIFWRFEFLVVVFVVRGLFLLHLKAFEVWVHFCLCFFLYYR